MTSVAWASYLSHHNSVNSSVTFLCCQGSYNTEETSITCQPQTDPAIGICHLPHNGLNRAVVAADLQHLLKGSPGWTADKGGTLCSGKSWLDRSSDRYFVWSWFYEPNFFYLLTSRNILKSFMVTIVLHD